MKILYTFILAVMLSLTSSAILNAQTADEIIDTYLENTGGKDAWRTVKSMKITGNGAQMGMNFPLTVYAKYPNKNKVVVDIQGKQMIEAFDGEVAWTINPFMGGTEPTKKTPEEAAEAAKETFEDDLLDYAEKGHTVSLEGTEEVDGVNAHKLKLTKKSGDEVMYFFDPDDLVPIMVRNFPQAGPMKGQTIETYSSDYQEVDGLFVPFSIEQKVGGQTMMTMTADKIELDVEIEDSSFSFPKK